jgi:hypothetical protein
MQYTRRDNETLFIRAGKVSFRERLIHNKDLSILRLDCFSVPNYEKPKCQSYLKCLVSNTKKITTTKKLLIVVLTHIGNSSYVGI